MFRKIGMIVVGSAIAAFGSTISSISVNNGSPTEILSVSTATATGNNMGAMLISVVFGNGDTDSCFWGINGCTGTNSMFTIDTDSGTENTYSVDWRLFNQHAQVTGIGDDIISMTWNALVGGVAFDLCRGNGSTQLDNDPCDQIGTTNSDIGLGAQSDGSGDDETASVVYSLPLYVGFGGSPVGDLYGFATFTFSSTFDNDNVFVWRMDTDLIQLLPPPQQGDVPEPSSMALLGGGLLALGVLARRRRK